MLTRPAHIPESVTRAPLDFPWSSEIAQRLDGFDAVPPRLGDALEKIDYKGKMAVGLACLEWVFWRLSGWTDVQGGLQRLEAAWASQVSAEYSRPLKPEKGSDDVHRSGDAAGPLRRASFRLATMHLVYCKGKTRMISESGRCALLASHVLPADCGFEAWLEETLTAVAVTDPCGPDYDVNQDSFDYSREAPVPRAWFETRAVPRDPILAKAGWDAFLGGLDASANPFLSLPPRP